MSYQATTLFPMNRRTEQRGLVVPWCWPSGARVLLAVLAMAAGLGLMRASWDIPSAPPTGLQFNLLLDVNTAPPRVLAALPHVGPALTSRLVEARTSGRSLRSNDIGDRVRGVGPVTRHAWRARIFISSPRPVLDRSRSRAVRAYRPALKPKAPRRKTTRTKRPADLTMPPRLTAMATSLSHSGVLRPLDEQDADRPPLAGKGQAGLLVEMPEEQRLVVVFAARLFSGLFRLL